MTFFVSKFHWSRSNSLSTAPIWRNISSLSLCKLILLVAVTVFLWLALIARRFELQMPDWSQMKDNLKQFLQLSKKKAYLNKEISPFMTKIDFAVSFSHENWFLGHKVFYKSQITDQTKEAPNTTSNYLPYESNLAP